MSAAVITTPLTPAEAQQLVNAINGTVADLLDLVERLYVGRGWQALGYPSWADMCRAEIVLPRLDRGDRADLVNALRGMGMSTRAIGSALGVSKDTVVRDLATVSDETVDEIVGLDGRRRPAKVSEGRTLSPTMSVELVQFLRRVGQAARWLIEDFGDRPTLVVYLDPDDAFTLVAATSLPYLESVAVLSDDFAAGDIDAGKKLSSLPGVIDWLGAGLNIPRPASGPAPTLAECEAVIERHLPNLDDADIEECLAFVEKGVLAEIIWQRARPAGALR